LREDKDNGYTSKKRKSVSIFLFESNGRKVIYAPCDCKPFPQDYSMLNADLLIIGYTFVGSTMKDNRFIGRDYPLRQELLSIEDVLTLKNDLSVPEVIITHIEEDWGNHTKIASGWR